MPSSVSYESPAPTEPLPNEGPTHPITWRAGKRLHVKMDPPEKSNPRTPTLSQKCTKDQAKWPSQIRTRSVTEPLPPLQETPSSPISISSEEEQVEPTEDIQSPHRPPRITKEPPEAFPEEYRTPSAEPFFASNLKLHA